MYIVTEYKIYLRYEATPYNIMWKS